LLFGQLCAIIQFASRFGGSLFCQEFVFMISSLPYVLGIFGAVLFMTGYRKINRNLMLVGTIFLIFSGGVNDFVTGWQSVAEQEQVKTKT
jgi:hypothetical protein